jgi:hypothetical protein
MAVPVVLVGPNIILRINNVPYHVAQTVSFSVDYGEEEIRGIDTPWAQEIASNKASVKGSISGVRVKLSGGLQAISARPLWIDMAASPYISIRITDRATGEDILYIQEAKVTNESHTISTKSTYKLNFSFTGKVPLWALDRT